MVKTLEFSNEDSAIIVSVTQFYFLAKELLLFGEQIDPKNNTLTQPINELRHCLDHLMRVTALKLGLKESDDEDDDLKYILKNLNKAYGHVYRAVYDSLDWISLTIRGFVSDELTKFSNEAIVAAIPDYFTILRPRLEEILTKDITELRKSKDVAININDGFSAHIKVVAELKDIRQKIVSAKSSLIEYENKRKISRKKKILFRILENFLVGVIIGLLVWFITFRYS